MRFVATGSWLLSATVDTCLLPWNHLAICVDHTRTVGSLSTTVALSSTSATLPNPAPLSILALLLLLLLLPLLLLVCYHCHCDVCLISQFISFQTTCQCRCRYLAISTRLCLFYAYSVCAVSSVSPVSSAFYASFTSFSAPSTSFTTFLGHRKSEKPKATPVKMVEFDVLTVCPRLALCYSCLAYATTSLSKRTPISWTYKCVCLCVCRRINCCR